MDTVLQILIIGGLLFVMMRFGCGSHMFGHGSKHKKDAHAGGHGGCCGGGHKHAHTADHKEPSRPAPPEKDVDPVCGKTVSTAEAKASIHGGLVYFFCSQECRDAFEAAPDAYLTEGAKHGPPPTHSLEHHAGHGTGHA